MMENKEQTCPELERDHRDDARLRDRCYEELSDVIQQDTKRERKHQRTHGTC